MPKPAQIIYWRKRREKRRKQRIRTWINVVVVFFLLLITLFMASIALATGGVTAVIASFTQDLPDFTELERIGEDRETTFETTKIYAWGKDEDRDGNRDLVLIYEIIDPLGGDREWLDINQIPTSFIDATISIEDKTFWSNQGFDIEGIGRAFYLYVIQGGNIQGGSSITQQVVKNNLIDAERRIVNESGVDTDDYRRKVEELVLSQRISSVYTKEQILEWYFNSNFYGNLAYGIEAAARVYFDKSAIELTIAESALLAAIPQSPAYNPIDNPDDAKVRQEIVLDAMFREGYITREQLIAAKQEQVVVRRGLADRFDIKVPHFSVYVRKELERRFGYNAVVGGGLTVYTTLDLEMQEQAECVARTQLEQLGGAIIDLADPKYDDCPAAQYLVPVWPEDQGKDHFVNNAALISMDPRTGEIKTMMGSIDYDNEEIDGSFNIAVDAERQPGSSFKPFTYVTALLEGYTPATMFVDVETDLGTPYNGKQYVPQNYDREFHGPMRMRFALSNSYNVPAVEAMAWVGVDKVIRTAHQMGITTLDKGSAEYGLSLTLGGGEVTLIDMVYAFSVFANMGDMIGVSRPESSERLGFRELDPVSILRVDDRKGQTIYEYKQPESREILPPQHTFLMNSMMSDRESRCEEFGCPNPLELPGLRQAAAKTGSTNGFRDGWTVGYTPQLVTGVWVGNTANTEMWNTPGSKGAAPIWNAFMSWALEGKPNETWAQPDGITEVNVCDLSGMVATYYCPSVREFFVEGTEPALIDNMYQRLRINKTNGKLATENTPEWMIEDQVFIVYPDKAADWVRYTNRPMPPTELDGVEYVAGNVAILSPAPFEAVSGTVPIFGNAIGPAFESYQIKFWPTNDPNFVRNMTSEIGQAAGITEIAQWNTFGLDGLYTVELTVNYGNRDPVSKQINVTVDNKPPNAVIVFPFEGQEVFVEDEWIVVQAQATDNFAIDTVQFYVDVSKNPEPFAIRSVPPFTQSWTIGDSAPGCHAFFVEATDTAGNTVRSKTVSACVVAAEDEG